MVPRQESYREDVLTAEKSGRNKIDIYTHLRAAAESGIDFSSRWFTDNKTLSTIITTDMIAVDLNALMYHMEMTIAKAKLINGDQAGAKMYKDKAVHRSELIDKYFWNKQVSFYTDYNFKTGTQKTISPRQGSIRSVF